MVQGYSNYESGVNIKPHEIKYDTLGDNADISQYDIYVDKNDEVFLQKKGSSIYIPTYENIGK